VSLLLHLLAAGKGKKHPVGKKYFSSTSFLSDLKHLSHFQKSPPTWLVTNFEAWNITKRKRGIHLIAVANAVLRGRFIASLISRGKGQKLACCKIKFFGVLF
jgi:hypothetical protein